MDGRALLKNDEYGRTTNPNPFVHNQLSSSLISPSELTPTMSSNTPPFKYVLFLTDFKLQVSNH